MSKNDPLQMEKFLVDYPGMSLGPSRNLDLILKGVFSFEAKPGDGVELRDLYELKISVSRDFPHSIPKVIETQKKIPRNGDFHVNHDGTLCLGSPMRLLDKIHKAPTLVGFAENCLVPYLYAVTNKLENGGDFVFSDLAHGEPGVVADYMDMLGLATKEQVLYSLILLGLKRRIANKKICPCGCGKRLGKCKLRLKINHYRKMTHRCWFTKHVKDIGMGM